MMPSNPPSDNSGYRPGFNWPAKNAVLSKKYYKFSTIRS